MSRFRCTQKKKNLISYKHFIHYFFVFIFAIDNLRHLSNKLVKSPRHLKFFSEVQNAKNKDTLYHKGDLLYSICTMLTGEAN